MHELALIEGILKTCLKAAKEQNASAIHKISLDIGQFAGVSVEALEFGFEVAKQGTLAQTASLLVQEMEAQAKCHACNCLYYKEKALDRCPKCGGALELLQGRELRIISMEVEECAKNAVV